MNFSHKFLPLLFAFFEVLIDFFFFRSLLLVVLGFSLIEVTVKLVPARTALYVIFLVVVSVFEVAEVVLALLCPKRVFFFLFLATDQVVHLGAPTLAELHVPDCQMLRIYLRRLF